MDFTIPPTTSTVELDSKLTMEIYEAIVLHLNADLAFKAGAGFSLANIKTVDKQADKILADIDKVARGNKVLSEAIPAILNNDGTVQTGAVAAVHFNPKGKGKTAFKAQFETGLFNKSKMLTDVVERAGYDYKSEFEKWLSSYEGSTK